MKMGTLEEKLSELLDSGSNEREIHKFLKENPLIVRNTFATSWNYAEVFSEVWFGSDYRVDFLVLCANSGSWSAHMVELKTPTTRLYSSSGDESKELRLVKRQLEQRKTWIDSNASYFRKELSRLLTSDDPGAMCSSPDEHKLARTEVQDPHVVIWEKYHAVIGRVSSMSENEQRRRREQMRSGGWGAPEVVTYDRFLHIARRLDGGS